MSTPNPRTVEVLNSALNRERQAHALPNDNELARHLGIAPKTLSFLRNGRWSPMTQILVNLLVSQHAAN